MKVFATTSTLAVIAALFSFAPSLHAGETAKEKTAASSKKSAAVAQTKAVAEQNHRVGGVAVVNAPSGGPLEEAFLLLSRADRDYKGHRAQAAHEVKTAARLLGQRLAGAREAGENQGTSDANLRQAQSLLSQAAGNLSGAPLQHVQSAIQHLTLALNTR
jgi:hypothetical protein